MRQCENSRCWELLRRRHLLDRLNLLERLLQWSLSKRSAGSVQGHQGSLWCWEELHWSDCFHQLRLMMRPLGQIVEVVRWCWERLRYLLHLGLLKDLVRAVGNVLQCERQQHQFHFLERPDSLKSLKLLATMVKTVQRQEQQLPRSHSSCLQTTG